MGHWSNSAIGAWRYVLLGLVMALLLMPRGVVWAIVSIILVIPVATTSVRRRDHAFLCWAVYVVAFVLFVFVRSVADAIGPGPFVRYPVLLDRILGLGTLPTQALQRWYNPAAPSRLDYIALIVYLTHFVSIPVVGLFVWRLRPNTLQPFLFGMAWLYLVAAATHVLVPTAPPWVAGQMGHTQRIYRPVMDLLGGSSSGVYKYGLAIAGGNDFAAMPSVHSAAAAMIGRASWGTPVAVLGLGYFFAMSLTLVYFGEHYVVDVLAGTWAALLCWSWGERARLPVPPRP